MGSPPSCPTPREPPFGRPWAACSGVPLPSRARLVLESSDDTFFEVPSMGGPGESGQGRMEPEMRAPSPPLERAPAGLGDGRGSGWGGGPSTSRADPACMRGRASLRRRAEREGPQHVQGGDEKVGTTGLVALAFSLFVHWFGGSL